MTPTEMRNERLAQRLMKNLARRHYESYYCKTAADIVGKVRELIPEGSSVTWGGSMSIRDTGVTRMLKEGSFTACPQLARTESSLTVFLSRPCLGRMVYLKLKRGERLEVTP